MKKSTKSLAKNMRTIDSDDSDNENVPNEVDELESEDERAEDNEDALKLFEEEVRDGG